MGDKDITDPTYVGPGVWLLIHQRALAARTSEEQKEVIEFIRNTCQEFPCVKCSEHCLSYMRDRPPEEYIGLDVTIGEKEESIGIFLWTWLFHNAVNARLGKAIVGWETAYNLYQQDGMVCSNVCMTG
jgi:Erv1 / Alr family